MLSAGPLRQIDIELAKYPADQRHSIIMGTLRTAQTEKGWLAPEAIAFVTDYIGVTSAQAYEVATFYDMHSLEPIDKYKLTVYTNLPCALRGDMDTGEYLKKKLGTGYGETTPNGKFTLVEGECMSAYGNTPVMPVNNHSICSFMTGEAIEEKLAELK